MHSYCLNYCVALFIINLTLCFFPLQSNKLVPKSEDAGEESKILRGEAEEASRVINETLYTVTSKKLDNFSEDFP